MMDFSKIDLVDADGHYHVFNPQLAKLAQEIHDEYVTQVQPYLDRPLRVGRKDWIHFYKAAIRCKLKGWSAAEYVNQQLAGMSRHGVFFPRAIACEKYGTNEAHGVWCVNTVRHYKAQLATYKERTRLLSPAQVLGDDMVPFTPLFRVVMASTLGLTAIVSKYREAAVSEYNQTPVAKELFGAELGSIQWPTNIA